jgi:hypothetical protein
VSGAGLTIIENIIRTATLEAAQEVGVRSEARSTEGEARSIEHWAVSQCRQVHWRRVDHFLKHSSSEATTDKESERTFTASTFTVCFRPLSKKAKECRRCPKCNVVGLKDPNGCAIITCNNCQFKYCWECLADYNVILQNDNSYHNQDCPFGPNLESKRGNS